MLVILILATLLAVLTVLLGLLWRLALALLRRPAPGFWRRALKANTALFVLHLLVTAPLVLGFLVSQPPFTRRDERDYAGPRIAADGAWRVQSRASLRADASGAGAAQPSLAADARKRAVYFDASDGVRLRAFLVPPVSGLAGGAPRFTAVLAHGWFRGALEIEVPGSMFRRLGGEVLLLEMRNHGDSGRTDDFTWGRDESLDVLAAVDFLQSRPGASERPLILFGDSGGAAAVALAAPRLPSLRGVVLDAPADDWRARARDLFPEPWATLILFSVRHIGGAPVDDVRPLESMRRLDPDVFVLLIGGGRDRRIPPASVRAYFEALPQPAGRKRLWIEPEAGHAKVWFRAPEEYERQLSWLCDSVVDVGPSSH